MAVLGLAACGVATNPGRSGPRDGGQDFSGFGNACGNRPADSDGDNISDEDEGAKLNPPRDTDRDQIPDYLDDDSDQDGIPDDIEGRNGNPCTPPVDSDLDGKPDFRDRDSDDKSDGTPPDSEEVGPNRDNPVDTDKDGYPDYLDNDDDGDGLIDLIELTPQGSPVVAMIKANAPDWDMDGTPDYKDNDADDDTIIDGQEGAVDTDGDGTPNFRDDDADGDCISDLAEAGDADPGTPPADTDKDGAPDFEDTDSDADGLVDGREDKSCDGAINQCETNRLVADSDSDKVSDLIEFIDCSVKTPMVQMMTMCMCDGSNASLSPLTRGDFVFISEYMVPPVPEKETLDLTTDVSRADVVFMLDVSSSMGACASNIATNIGTTIVPGVAMKVRDTAFGLVTFSDFKDPFVVKYDHKLQTVKTAAAISSMGTALTGVTIVPGGDWPEAGWEALYSTAGGPALTISGAGIATWTSAISPLRQSLVGEESGTLGGVGFRTGAVPIIVAITDAEFHDRPLTTTSGENGLNNYSSTTDCNITACNNVPSRLTAIDRANAIGANVMGLACSGGTPKDRLRALAVATSAQVKPADFGLARPGTCSAAQCCTGPAGAGEGVQADGNCPLAYTIDRSGGSCPVTQSIVDGIVALANGLRFDIHVVASDVDPGTVDNFIDRLEPNVSGMGPAALCVVVDPATILDLYMGPKATPKPPNPAPGDGVKDTFTDLGGAQRICFDVVAKQNNAIEPTSEPQIFRARLQVKGESKRLVNGVPTTHSFDLGTPREVFFLIPPVIVNGPIG